MLFGLTNFIKKLSPKGIHANPFFVYQLIVFIKNCAESYDIIFADPPYDLPKIETIPGLVFGKELLNENGRLVIEHGFKISYAKEERFLERREYGDVNFSILA